MVENVEILASSCHQFLLSLLSCTGLYLLVVGVVLTLQYFPAAAHAFLTLSGAGCHDGGPAFDRRPMETPAALIMPTPFD
jgi:hypothetical protein